MVIAISNCPHLECLDHRTGPNLPDLHDSIWRLLGVNLPLTMPKLKVLRCSNAIFNNNDRFHKLTTPLLEKLCVKNEDYEGDIRNLCKFINRNQQLISLKLEMMNFSDQLSASIINLKFLVELDLMNLDFDEQFEAADYDVLLISILEMKFLRRLSIDNINGDFLQLIPEMEKLTALKINFDSSEMLNEFVSIPNNKITDLTILKEVFFDEVFDLSLEMMQQLTKNYPNMKIFGYGGDAIIYTIIWMAHFSNSLVEVKLHFQSHQKSESYVAVTPEMCSPRIKKLSIFNASKACYDALPKAFPNVEVVTVSKDLNWMLMLMPILISFPKQQKLELYLDAYLEVDELDALITKTLRKHEVVLHEGFNWSETAIATKTFPKDDSCHKTTQT